MQNLFRDFANPEKGAHGKRPEKLRFLRLRNERQTVGFLMVAGNFGQQFVGRDADGDVSKVSNYSFV
jgi:hypothetical protein